MCFSQFKYLCLRPIMAEKRPIVAPHSVGKRTFFLRGAVEFWYYLPKKVLVLPCVLTKKTPDPPPLVTDKSVTLPSLLHGMFHAVETSEHFACECKMFEYKYILSSWYISILNMCELKQENANNQSGIFAEVSIRTEKDTSPPRKLCAMA